MIGAGSAVTVAPCLAGAAGVLRQLGIVRSRGGAPCCFVEYEWLEV